jgi:Flp pilus assembly protein TadG
MRIFQSENLKQFKQDASGNIAMIFGLAFVPLMLAVGVAVDTINVVNTDAKVAKALDSAVLAVAASSSSLGNTARETIGEKTYYANLPVNLLNAASSKPKFKITGEKITASVAAVADTGIMSLAGIDTVDLNVGAEVSVKEKKSAEIALVLDYSGSMREVVGGEVKYVAMRTAATKLIDDLTALDKDKVKFGLVPFSHHVMARLPNQYVADANFSGSRLTCTQDRPYPANVTDSAPGSSDSTKWGQPQAPEHLSEDCSGYFSRGLTVQPLTNDFNALKSQLARMEPYAWTHIALGAEFGFHVLSPNAPFTQGAAYNTKTVEKFMVLLTDGKQTEPAFGPGGVRSVAQGEKNLLSICSAAKKKGIKIISIAFDLDDSATRQNLESCASDPSQFFVVQDGRELASAFDTIKQLLLTEFYMSK